MSSSSIASSAKDVGSFDPDTAQQEQKQKQQELNIQNGYDIDNDSHIYDGLDNQSIRDVARSFTSRSNKSTTSIVRGDVIDESGRAVERCASVGGENGVVPPVYGENGNGSGDSIDSGVYDSRLDPNSEDFSSVAWVQNFHKLVVTDPDYYKPYKLGLAYKNLRSYGDSTDIAYQTTMGNVAKKGVEWVARKLRKKRESDIFNILKPMDGYIKPSTVTVVLGKPGSGCSTLLKTMCSNTPGFEVDPESVISYNGLTPSEIKKHYRGEVVYNGETDVHFPHLTVYQTLNTVAKLVTPRNRIKGLTREEFAHHITEVYMATYGLSHTKNTKVGNDFVRGVSGGERKRVSIAEVSICGSKLQCWDNATRGLDAATALEFIKALKTQAVIQGVTSVVAIYQCSQDAYDLFDNVVVLDEGYQLYFGPGTEAKAYFQKMGYKCPPRQTTADFLTAVTSPSERVVNPEFIEKGIHVPSTPQEMERYWKNSDQYKKLMRQVDEQLTVDSESQREVMSVSHHAKQSKRAPKKSPYTVDYILQVKYLLTRNFQRIRNDLGFTIFSVGGNSIMALILASMFYKIMYHTDTKTFYSRGGGMFFAILFNSFASLLEIMSLFEARPIVEKHKSYALYHPSAEAVSSVISQLPAKLLTCIAFNLFFYFMVNFRRDAGVFFFYLLINWVATLAMSHIFRCIGSATNTLSEAMVPATIILLALSMYTGFAIPKTAMLGWSKWIYWINPLSYGFESLMINEFHGRDFDCATYLPSGSSYDSISLANKVCSAVGAVPGEDFVNGDRFLKLSYSYEHKHKWRGFGVLVAYLVFFFGVYMFFSEFSTSAVQKGEVLVYPQSALKKAKNSKGSSTMDLENGPSDNSSSEKGMLKEEQEEDVDSDNSMALKSADATLHWRDLCYDVPIKKETRRILNNVDGWVAKSSITALMGSSGAGKTTLLDCLASRVTMGVVTGDIFVNGRLRDKGFPRSIGYCQQQDLHLSTATVRESLRFSAYLRQPSKVSKEEKDKYVEEVIKILEMEKYADAVVGVTGEGLNVEQRKRLTIGVELAAKPQLLIFLDEPTSGLDSQTAWSICDLMRKLANHGQAILCTIHQPSSILMEQFDRLLFLQRGGKTVYFGDLGKGCKTMIEYFEKNGAPQCPVEANPAEWMLEVIGAAPGSHADKDYHEVWKNSPEFQNVQSTLDDMERELPKIELDLTDAQSYYANTIFYQYLLVSQRLFQQYWRTPTYLFSKLFLTVYAEIFIGFTFFKANKSLQGLQNQMLSIFMFCVIFNPYLQQYMPIYISQREMYEARERPARTFSWIAFMLAQITVEVPYNFVAGTIAFFCYYYPVGMYNNASHAGQLHERGALFWLYAVGYYVYIGSTALMVAAPFEIIATGGNLASLMFTMALSFNGVLVSRENMAGFWVFMYRVSPLTYFVSGTLATGLANNVIECSDYEYNTLYPPSGMSCSEYLDPYFKAAGTGYLKDPNSTDECQVCSMSTTNSFLKTVGSSYDTRWRNWGIFICYIAFNYIVAVLLYYLCRVPKSSNLVANERDPSKTEAKASASGAAAGASSGVAPAAAANQPYLEESSEDKEISNV
ncbi:ATP-binding cassette multidrug transporter pdr5 [Hanseniaspora osmophila]